MLDQRHRDGIRMLARNLLKNCDDPRASIETMIDQMRGVADLFADEIGYEPKKKSRRASKSHEFVAESTAGRVLCLGDAPPAVVKIAGKH